MFNRRSVPHVVFIIIIITSEQLILHLSIQTGSRLVRESAGFENVASRTFARWTSEIAFENLMGSNRLSEIDSRFICGRQLGRRLTHPRPPARPPPRLQSPDAHEPTAAAAEDKGEESKGSLGGKFCIMKRSLSRHPAMPEKNRARRQPVGAPAFCARDAGRVSPRARGASPTSPRARKQSFWEAGKNNRWAISSCFVFSFNKRDKAPRFHFAD